MGQCPSTGAEDASQGCSCGCGARAEPPPDPVCARRALERAISLERRCVAAYEAWHGQADGPAARSAFFSLLQDERRHLGELTYVYERLLMGSAWPRNSTRRAEPVPTAALVPEAFPGPDGQRREQACRIEQASLALYRNLSRASEHPMERSFYEALADEERGHLVFLGCPMGP